MKGVRVYLGMGVYLNDCGTLLHVKLFTVAVGAHLSECF